MLGYKIIKSADYENLKIKARQHDTLKIYTDDKIRELESMNRALLEENGEYRDAIRKISNEFNCEKQKQHYNSIENFIKKVNTKINEILKRMKI